MANSLRVAVDAWLCGTALAVIASPTPATAQTVPATAAPVGEDSRADLDTAPDAAADTGEITVTGRNATRSVSQISGVEIQKVLPGISPLKAIQTLPGVTFLTADPWGNIEQNISLFIHGFNAQQFGYTLDGLPLGDQQYGNYNGLSPQRAIISEDVGRVTLATGAGDLGTASTSNLGGAIDTFSSDPRNRLGITVEQVVDQVRRSGKLLPCRFLEPTAGDQPTTTITAIVSGATILQNVGDVKTDGVDAAGTLRFGSAFSVYNAVSYNNSRFQDDYLNGATTVRTAGRKVPGSPNWLDKTVVTSTAGPAELQLIGDYVGRRYATFTNDLSVKGYFTLSGRGAVDVPLSEGFLVRKLTISLNVTNITNKRAESTLSIGAASGTYNFFPVAPRQYFGTVSVGF